MRTLLSPLLLVSMLTAADSAIAQTRPPQDPDMPITFANVIPDVCLGVASTNASPSQAILERLPKRPVEIADRYPHVPVWYRLKKKPENIFIGVGDKPNLCHIVMTNSKDGRQSFSAAWALLRSAGYSSTWAADGSAVLVLIRKAATGNSLILLNGLTNATDGVGPQVSVDVGSATDEQLRLLLGRK